MIKPILTLLCLLMPVGLAAQDAALQSAITGWLNEEDEVNSLPALSALANNGNVDAQLLLGQIDRDTVPGGYSAGLFALTLQQRNALLRSDVTAISRNWLLALTDPSQADFGLALFEYRTTRDWIGFAVKMQAFEESASAQYLLWQTFNIGQFDKVNAMPSNNHGLANVAFMNWLRGYLGSADKTLTINRFVADTTPGKVMGLLSIERLAGILNLRQYFSTELKQMVTILRGNGGNLPDNANLVALNQSLHDLADTDPTLSIAVRACDKCTLGQPDYDCIIQSLEMVGGYESLMAIRTPVERIIPADQFMASNRPVAIYTNLIRSYSDYYPLPIRSACIASIIAE